MEVQVGPFDLSLRFGSVTASSFILKLLTAHEAKMRRCLKINEGTFRPNGKVSGDGQVPSPKHRRKSEPDGPRRTKWSGASSGGNIGLMGGISAVPSGRKDFGGVYQTRCVWLISGVAPRHRGRVSPSGAYELIKTEALIFGFVSAQSQRPVSFLKLLTAHEPKKRKCLKIKESTFRFMGRSLGTDMFLRQSIAEKSKFPALLGHNIF